MTPEIGLIFVLLAVMAYLFPTEKLRVVLTAFLGLVVLTLAGTIMRERGFQPIHVPAFTAASLVLLVPVFAHGG